ncbi:TolC family protein [Pantoea phytobeneficialis]|uniref:RND transporter n=1 Tax=Pantoea phytobeneficialis TaxID=2052056 RepID=A0AAP9HAX0_9GAMM|nr:TolC family protein [Pantoea phytobeneficialis]MDO6409901.1 TolC family protein [Pantoea phytobeneficialis]QGR09772.1 RND transporter [Pantoea phytobeneficialis]
MNKSAGCYVALFPLLLAGCTSGPEQPPITTLPVKLDGQSASIPDKWWTLYHDADLNHAVEQALTNNRDLRMAAANLRAAKAVVDETDAARLPTTSLNTQAGYGSTANDQLEAALNQSDHIRTGARYGIGIDVQWEIDFFGRLRSMRHAANADALAVMAEEEGARVLVAAETTRAWLSACSYAQRIGIAQRSLLLAAQGQQLASQLYQSGAGVELDVIRAQNQVELAAAELPPLQAARHNALAELAVLMGQLPDNPPQAAMQCQSTPSLTSIAVPHSEGMRMLSRRPDVLKAQQALIAATARIGVATADFYPQISIGGSVFSSAHQPDGWDKSGATVWSLGPLISWSFPNVSEQRARLAQANAHEQSALAHFDAIILGALKDVQQGMTNYNAALQQNAALQKAAAGSQHALKLASIARKEGAATALAFLDAQRTDIAIQHQLASADTQLINTQIALFKSLGGGWQQAPAIPLPEPQRRPVPSQISLVDNREIKQ